MGHNGTSVVCRGRTLCLHSPVLRKRMILNMDRTVGTITPKKVFSCRGSLLGVPWLESDRALDSAPHTVDVMVRPHTPEVIRGVRSLDMAAHNSS